MAATIDIVQANTFGARGSANGQFDYPRGITILNGEIYIVDSQNHRVQVFDLLGNYQRQFGTQGAGNDQFYFPEDITDNGTDLFITDSANHRIKRHQTDGVFISAFGTRGSGDAQFDYPVGIEYYNNALYVVDKQNHRVKKHALDGTLLSKIGTYGTTTTKFNYPEGVAQLNGEIIIADSGNKKVKYFDANFNYQTQISGFEYPTFIFTTTGNITGVVDKQASTLYFYDENQVLIKTFTGALSFPYDAYYYNDKLYVVDGGNHRVIDYNYTISLTTPKFTDKFVNLTRQLYPTGRAWNIPLASVFKKFHEGLALSESRAYENAIGLYDSLIPDNDNFTAQDATRWEKSLGLFDASNLSITDRKAAILRKMKFPGNEKYRGTDNFVENQLREAGFDVYVHENRFPDGAGGYEVFQRDDYDLQTKEIEDTFYTNKPRTTGILRSSDGTILYIVQKGTPPIYKRDEDDNLLLPLEILEPEVPGNVYQYDLTGTDDLTGISLTKTLEASTWDLEDVMLANTDSKLYLVYTDKIEEYDLSNAGEIDSETLVNTKSTSGDLKNIQGAHILEDGSKFFAINPQNNVLLQIIFGTNYDITTISIEKSVAYIQADAYDVFLRGDGTEFYILRGNEIEVYGISANDIDTLSLKKTVLLGFDTYGFEFKPDKTIMYTIADDRNIRKYNIFRGPDIDFTILANYIDENQDTTIPVETDNDNIFVFFVAGETFEPSGTKERASVNADRKNEFRELILRTKPAHALAYLLIDYT